MSSATLDELQSSVRDGTAFTTLDDYLKLCLAYLDFIENSRLTRIVSPTQTNYFFLQYGEDHRYKITRPLNSTLFFRSAQDVEDAYPTRAS